MKIYVLDDDVFFGNLVKNFLVNHIGADVEYFHNEDNCLDAIISKSPMLFILDQNLPSIKGLEMMRLIREKNPNAEFIFISGIENSQFPSYVIRSGALGYVHKSKRSFLRLLVLIRNIKWNTTLKPTNLIMTIST